jgi:HlyD family secretion protein
MSALRCVALALGLLAAAALASCGNSQQTYQGWVEADLVFVGPDEAGRLDALSVREGDSVTLGAPLFRLESELQDAEVFAAKAALANARQSFERAQQLLKTGAGTQKAHDDAQAVLREAEARLNSAQTRLARRAISSPVSGPVQQIYFRPGELVPAGRPVVAILPPGNLKVRFYVPQAMLPKIGIGDTVRVLCDGCADDLSAQISFIARAAEFTPPVIYSLEERSKLVFLVEARPNRPDALRVGQPVSVLIRERTAQP